MFESLVPLVKDKIDILMISETKLDDTFPFSQFTIEGYSQQFRLDRNCHGGGIIIYVRGHLTCKKINSYSLPGNVKEIFDFVNLIKKLTCYKNPKNPSSIDVMLTNRTCSFQHSTTIETGLSDYHKMTITVLNNYCKKQDPLVINYRDYKNFNEGVFREDLRRKLEVFDVDC